MSLANEVKREYPMKALFDSFVAGKRLAVDEVREALNPDADLREQLDRIMELVLMLVAANQRLRESMHTNIHWPSADWTGHAFHVTPSPDCHLCHAGRMRS